MFEFIETEPQTTLDKLICKVEKYGYSSSKHLRGAWLSRQWFEIADYLKRLAEAEKDAARYRWLANHIEHPEMFWVQWALTKECIDAQIDEAIKLFPHGFKKPSLNGYKND